MRLLQRFFGRLGFGGLLRRMIEDGGAVLCSPVRALAVELRGIVILPENLEQVGVANFGRIVVNFNRFGVARAVSADVFVRGTLGLPAEIADAGRGHAGNLSKSGLDSPETSCCKCCLRHEFSCLYVSLIRYATGGKVTSAKF